jgi:hypothetical protein
MRLVSLGLAVAILGAVLPAWADKTDTYALIAAVTAGLSDGGSVTIGDLGTGKVSRTGPKAYVVNLPGGQATFIFDQPAPCVFTELSQMKGRPPLTVQFDLGMVSAINFADQGQQDGLNAVGLKFDGDGAIVQVLADDGTAQIAAPQASIITSVSLDALRRAAIALHAACPGQ